MGTGKGDETETWLRNKERGSERHNRPGRLRSKDRTQRQRLWEMRTRLTYTGNKGKGKHSGN